MDAGGVSRPGVGGVAERGGGCGGVADADGVTDAVYSGEPYSVRGDRGMRNGNDGVLRGDLGDGRGWVVGIGRECGASGLDNKDATVSPPKVPEGNLSETETERAVLS